MKDCWGHMDSMRMSPATFSEIMQVGQNSVTPFPLSWQAQLLTWCDQTDCLSKKLELEHRKPSQSLSDTWTGKKKNKRAVFGWGALYRLKRKGA